MALFMLILSFLLRYVQPAIASVSGLDVRQASADSSNSRSLWSIVSGCLATILACTWISVHSNIPAPTDSALQVLGRRLAIMFNLLIVPEFVIAWAARQYLASREIHRRHKARGWTKTHAFFVIMGGFSLYENGKLVRTLDIFELEKLEKEGKVDWPIITEEEIKDKSKGDYISKGVVVLQTCWFIAQVIARGAEHMVVTELEIVTLAFSALTMIIYFLWWHKPLDVGVSVPVHLKDGFSMPSEVASTKSPPLVRQESPDQEFRRFCSGIWAMPWERASTTIPPLVCLEIVYVVICFELRALGRYFFANGTPTTDDTAPHESTDQVLERLKSRENEDARPIFTPKDQPLMSSALDIEMQPLPLESGKNFQSTRSSSQHDSASVRSSANSCNSNRQMWKNIIVAIFLAIFLPTYLAIILALSLALLIVAVGTNAVLYIPVGSFFELMLAIFDTLACKKLNKKHPTRVPTFYSPKSESEYISYVTTIGVSIGFGSIHCIAWSFSFPSFAEHWLWRITSILITALPLVVVFAPVFAVYMLSRDDEDNGKYVSNIAVWLTRIGKGCCALLLLIFCLAYIGARFCLLVLPLYALRALPEGAYDDVVWPAFVPHIHI